MMSQVIMNESENIWELETDPLEIEEEICIKEEKIDVIKQEPVDTNNYFENYDAFDSHIEVKEENIISNDTSSSNQPVIQKIIDTTDLLKNNQPNLAASNTRNFKNVKIVQLNNKVSSTNSVIDKIIKREPTCYCMKSIEYYCTKCEKTSFYSKDKIVCSICNGLLKLQCRKCHKRYKILNGVVLQLTKQLPVLNSEKQNTLSSSIKTEIFSCTKCSFNSKHEALLKKHITVVHMHPVDKADEYIKLYCVKCKKSCKRDVYENAKQVCGGCYEEMYYQCVFCSKSYKTLRNMRYHVSHVCWYCINSNKLECPFCNFEADSIATLTLHKKIHKVKICLKCNEEVYGTEGLKEHLLKHGDVNVLNKDLNSTSTVKDVHKVTKSEKEKTVIPKRSSKQEKSVSLTFSDEDANLLNDRKIVKSSALSVRKKDTVPPTSSSVRNPSLSSATFDEDINLLDRLNATEVKSSASHVRKSNAVPPKPSNKHKLSISSTHVDDSNSLNQSSLPYNISLLDDEDCFKIVKNDPDILIKGINSRPKKDINSIGWRDLIDYYCLLCDREAKKKFSRFKPRCPYCKTKYDYRCINCERLYGSYTSIYRHVKSECLNRQTLKCSLCDFSSVRKYRLISHLKTKHTVYQCLRCNCTYEGYLSLKTHQKNECKIENLQDSLDIKQSITLYCENCFKRSKIPRGEKLMPCGECKKKMNYQCLKCNRQFADQNIIYKHVKEECKPTFCCPKCTYKAYIQYDLDVHIKYMHTSNRCIDCGVQFKDKRIFKLHRLEEVRRKEMREKGLNDNMYNQSLSIGTKRVDSNQDSTSTTKGKKLKSN